MLETLPDRLRLWRERAGLTQNQAASVFYVSPQAYRNWEQGRFSPRGRPMELVEAVLKRAEAWSEMEAS